MLLSRRAPAAESECENESDVRAALSRSRRSRQSPPAPPLCPFLSTRRSAELTHTFASGLAGEARRDLRGFNFQCVRMLCVCVCVYVRGDIDCVLRSLGATLSCPGATPKHISQGAIRNLITALNCSLSASLLLSPPRLFSPLPAPSSFKRCICARLTLFPRCQPLTFVALSCRFGRKCPLVLLCSRRQEKRGASPKEPRQLQQK